MSKNLESLACTFIHFNFLSWALLPLSYTLILIVLLCLPCKIWRSFVSFCFARLWRICFLLFFLTSLLPNLELSKPHACIVCIALPANLVVVPTQGVYFVFFFLRKQLYFGSEGVARDKLVFWMKKHGHVSFQVMTEDSYSLNFGIEPLINMLLIIFFYSFSFSFLFFFFLLCIP